MSKELIAATEAFQAALSKRGSGQEILYTIIPMNDITKMYSHLEKVDDQTADLFADVVTELMGKLDPGRGATEALLRIQDVVARGKSWDPALIRNNVFKAANSLGMRLPSHSF